MCNGNIQQNPLCVESCVTNTVFYGDKILYKILNLSTRFSCQHFAVEDFVTLFMGIKYCRWGNAMFGHGFDKLV